MKSLWKRLVKEEEGLETVEYAVLGALVILGTIVAIEALAGGISNTFDTLTGEMPQ